MVNMSTANRRFNRTSTSRFIGVAAAATLLLAALIVSGCGGDDDKEKTSTFETPTYPFSFSYPSGWKVARNAEFNFGSDEGRRSVAVTLKNPHDQVTVTQYKLEKTLPEGFNGNQREIDRIVRRLTREAKGTASDATTVSYGGIPGYQYVVEYQAEDDTELRNTLTFLFKGDDEFQINCQSSPANRAALDAGCEEVLGTLKFD